MKIYEYIKGENKRTAKLFGLTIMEQTSDYMTSERYQKFFGGIISTIKINDKYIDCSNKEIKIFNQTIIKLYEKNNYRIYCIGNKELYRVSLFNEFKRKYFKYLDKKYDDIYILHANSGETYLTLTYIIDALIKKNNSKSPLLIATQKYHVDMIKMICLDIPYVYVSKFKLRITENFFKIDKFRFFLLFNNSHFKLVEKNIRNYDLGKYHYFYAILERLNISEQEISMRPINVNLNDEKKALEKVQKTGLNLEKFVFLAPEAQSCKLYDKDFWIELIKGFQFAGYDVFVNLVEDEIKFEKELNYKSCYLTFGEAFALAKHSKKIVSLRSGFTEFLLQTNVPVDVIYTKFRKRHFFDDLDIYHVMSGFGLTQLPFVDKSKIMEFNTYEMTAKNCVEMICKQIKG